MELELNIKEDKVYAVKAIQNGAILFNTTAKSQLPGLYYVDIEKVI